MQASILSAEGPGSWDIDLTTLFSGWLRVAPDAGETLIVQSSGVPHDEAEQKEDRCWQMRAGGSL